MARALLRRAHAAGAALARLRALASAGLDRMGLEAAIVLAEEHDVGGLDTLRQHVAGSDAALRRSAVRALARSTMRPFEVRDRLEDDDARVRVAAAGGIVAAYAAR